MPISSIGGLGPLTPKLPSTGNSAGSASGGDFGAMLKQTVGALQQLGTQADSSSLSLAKGAPIDIHEVMIANEQASLGFSMAVQVRNKLVDAYAEVMRMSV
jgi:flagellar hook-basal body complex protein FliE